MGDCFCKNILDVCDESVTTAELTSDVLRDSAFEESSSLSLTYGEHSEHDEPVDPGKWDEPGEPPRNLTKKIPPPLIIIDDADEINDVQLAEFSSSSLFSSSDEDFVLV